jgi:3-oxoacyl-[acyl-carrier-protein] synthase I
MGRLIVTALGAVTSVGRGATGSCAAIRAGLSRPGPVHHFKTIDIENHEGKPLSGHPIKGLTDGFAPNARWLIMARRALADLMGGSPAPGYPDASLWSRCGVVYLLPVLDDARFFHAPLACSGSIWGSFLDPITAETGLSLDRTYRSLVAVGPGGLACAVNTAAAWLDRRAVDRVLLIAVDSLLDAWSLTWLASGRRLKDDQNPAAVTPGEAAIAIMLEGVNSRSVPLATVTASIFREDDQPFQNTARRQGRTAFVALDQALSLAGPRLEGDLYVNLNGEEWRAAELGSALALLPVAARGTYRLTIPASSVGDVGTAAGALHVVCALRSFARGYATAAKAWLLTTSDYGDTSVLCLEAA